MKRKSIEFEISVIYVTILGIVLIAYRIFLLVGFSGTLYREKDNELNLKAQEICRLISESGASLGLQTSDLSAVEKQLSITQEEKYRAERAKAIFGKVLADISQRLHLSGDYIRILNINSVIIAGSDDQQDDLLFISAEELKKLKSDHPIYKNVHIRKKTFRLLISPFSYISKKTYIIQVATPINNLIGILQKRIYNSFIAITIILLIAHIVARLLTIRILKPVENLAKTARGISLKDLSARVQTEKLGVEMKYLAESFNDMIARIEKSFEYAKEFSSSIAHELKTPLAIMKGEATIALRKERPGDDYREALKVTIEESNRMIAIVEDLLFLTKLDYTPENIKKEHFDFVQYFKDIQQKITVLTVDKGITLNVKLPTDSIMMDGNKLYLSRLFYNIIQNAVKFTAQGGKIDIAVKAVSKTIRVSISDNGMGISEKDLPRIFNRFFHADKYKSEETKGMGLGLHIAKSIAQFHNGDIEVKSKVGEGSTFTVILPTV